MNRLRFSLGSLLLIVTALSLVAGAVQMRRSHIASEIADLKVLGVAFSEPLGFWGVPHLAEIEDWMLDTHTDEAVERLLGIGVPRIDISELSKYGVRFRQIKAAD